MKKEIREYKDYRFLTREEEIAAWERGDKDALVESVWPFVLRTVRKLAGSDDGIYVELISEAGLILANSLRTYDAHKTRFISYSCRFLVAQLTTALTRYRNNNPPMVGCVAFEWTAAAPGVDPLELDESKQDLREVATALQQVCTEREYEVFVRRAQGENFREIGERNGYTRQRAQQLFEAAKTKARTLFPSLVEGQQRC